MTSLAASIFGHLVEHLLKLLIFFIHFAFVEVFDSFSWSTQLNENNGSLFYGDVPIILKLEDKLPNGQANELRIPLEEFQIT